MEQESLRLLLRLTRGFRLTTAQCCGPCRLVIVPSCMRCADMA